MKAVATRATDEELAQIRHLVLTADGVVDEQRLSAADAAFHRLVAAVSGNTILAQMLDALRDLFTDEGRVVHWEPLARDWDVRAHVAIVDALERRDAVSAAERMRAHLQSVRDEVTRLRGAQRTA